MIPEMTQVALQTHKKDMMREQPDFAKRNFCTVFPALTMKRIGEKTT